MQWVCKSTVCVLCCFVALPCLCRVIGKWGCFGNNCLHVPLTAVAGRSSDWVDYSHITTTSQVSHFKIDAQRSTYSEWSSECIDQKYMSTSISMSLWNYSYTIASGKGHNYTNTPHTPAIRYSLTLHSCPCPKLSTHLSIRPSIFYFIAATRVQISWIDRFYVCRCWVCPLL